MISDLIKKHTCKSLLQSSRIHKANNYFDSNSVFIKRDDELGFGIGGSKVRKFSSLLFYLQQTKPEFTVIEGSLNSNNVLGLSALLNSLNINTKLVLPKSHSPNKGNALWTKATNQEINFVETSHTYGNPKTYYEEYFGSNNVFIIKEGAAQFESIPGLLTLAAEIAAFSDSENKQFNQIFIDSGTGITAIGLIIGLKLIGLEIPICITQIAGTENEFRELFKSITNHFNNTFLTNLSTELKGVDFVKPVTSKSFGSINQTMKKEWLNMMQHLGFPVDLTYTAKHFYTIKKQLENTPSDANKLIINCGSWFAARNHEAVIY